MGHRENILTMYFMLHYILQKMIDTVCMVFIVFFVSIVLRPKGLRDDLVLLEGDLSHINLCSLHCEMCNTEQLLGFLGLFAYRVGCLDLLNAA